MRSRSVFVAVAVVALAGCGGSSDESGPGSGPGSSAAKATQVASGWAFSCALMGDKTVRCWGQSMDATSGWVPPTAVSGLTDVVEIGAGGDYACARRADGTVWCWGEGTHGELGSATTQTATPLQVGVSGAAQLACGAEHACILDAAGQVYCWGANNLAQLGDGSVSEFESTPVKVSGVSGATSLSIGPGQSCALVSGSVWCWGASLMGSTTVRLAPEPIPNATGFSRLAPSHGSHICGILSDSRVACWGNNDEGQLGMTGPALEAPAPVPNLTNVAQVTVGGTPIQVTAIFKPTSTCAALTDGSLYCWGSNLGGELGDGTQVSHSEPALVALNDVVSVSLGGQDLLESRGHACAVTADGSVQCWGANYLGQLGDGTTNQRSTPAPVQF